MSTPCDLFGSDGLFGPASESNNLFGCVTTNEDRKSSNTLSKKSCFSTPKLTNFFPRFTLLQCLELLNFYTFLSPVSVRIHSRRRDAVVPAVHAVRVPASIVNN